MVTPGLKERSFRILIFVFVTLVIIFGAVMFSQTLPYLSFRFAVDFLGTKTDSVLRQWDFNFFFYTHIISSLVVLLSGVSQFVPFLARTYQRTHKTLGQVYIFLILLIAAPSGLGLSLYANGGLPAKVGFFIQSLLWFLITLKAFYEIKQQKIESHIQWMMRSYAITLAAMSLRTESYLMKSIFDTRPFETYLTVVWVSWVGNLIFCEILIVSGFSNFLLHSLRQSKNSM